MPRQSTRRSAATLSGGRYSSGCGPSMLLAHRRHPAARGTNSPLQARFARRTKAATGSLEPYTGHAGHVHVDGDLFVGHQNVGWPNHSQPGSADSTPTSVTPEASPRSFRPHEVDISQRGHGLAASPQKMRDAGAGDAALEAFSHYYERFLHPARPGPRARESRQRRRKSSRTPPPGAFGPAYFATSLGVIAAAAGGTPRANAQAGLVRPHGAQRQGAPEAGLR